MPKFHFTSDHLPSALPARMRAKMWTESMDVIGSSFEMGIVASRKFHGEIAVLHLGRIQLGSAKTITDGTVSIIRSEAKFRRDRDDRVMILINRGETPMSVSQFNRTVELNRHDMTVLAMDIPSECATPQSGHSHVILLPREILRQPGRMLESLSATRLTASRAAQILLRQNVQQLLDAEEEFDPPVEIASGEYIVQLAIHILQRDDLQPAIPPAAMPDARIADIRKQVARNYRMANLNPRVISEQLGMSTRSIQQVLRQHGTTFSEELMAMRLEAAFGMLRSGAAESIASIAFTCGFSDLSTFHRAFRARYGKPPGAVRAAK